MLDKISCLSKATVRKLVHAYKVQSLRICKMSTTNGLPSNTEITGPGIVAVCQMNCKPNKDENIKTGKSLIEKAKVRGAKMVFLPECFDYVGESREQSISMAENLDGPVITQYKNIAKSLNVWLSLGGFHEKGPEHDASRIYNTHIIINSKGDIVATYHKTHLFDVDIKGGVKLKETDFTIPGSAIEPPVKTPLGNLGIATCYDLRFPEMSVALRQQGAQILTYPSAFTQPTGMAHWEVLLRSRAIENQCYVVAAAQTGKHHAKRSSYGHAMVVDPWGAVVCQCKEGEDVAVTEIDLTYLNKVRTQMPVQQHRRCDIYRPTVTSQKEPIVDNATYAFGQHTIKRDIIFYKTHLTMAFVNRKCVVPGHVLVSPIRVVQRFSEMTPEEVSDLFTVSQRVATVVESHYGCSSVTVGLQDGPDAGQTVMHVHVHILPRKPGDFKRNDDIYSEMEKHDKDSSGEELEDSSSEWRTPEDMAAEASTLRQLFKDS
ncbi:unnamed protein product [Owenia fusiformis]|uniref:Bis(5'-adenosyl)-triphosphatase n=1 Tax=Owenia fusiformis TaxID=6347 RepID=A0A8J1T6G2_OWEFU|nr:unnamed protein product [Owenia fusiformis]